MRRLHRAPAVPQHGGSRFRQRLVCALLMSAALVASGCSEGPQSTGSVDLTQCGGSGEARCGYVAVPVDWARPEAAQMRLKVMVLPAHSADGDADPLFYLTGMGGAATADAEWAAQMFAHLNQTRDLVFVDQRGTGGSSRQTCPGLQQQAADPDREAIRSAVRDCLASVARDPRHDTTVSAVRDLDLVRKALGYEQVNLYGISYGVSVGLAYLQRYDSHVRSAVLDSGSLLDVPLWELVPMNAQRSFDQLARRCSADPGCAASYDPARDLAKVTATLRVHPARVAIGYETVTIDLPGFLNSLIDDYLASPETAVLLPADLHALARGQWSAVLEERGPVGLPSAEELVQLQELTIKCSDAWARMDPSRIAKQEGSAFTPATAANAASLNAVCAEWPHDPGVDGTVDSSVPVLFLNGTADPADPPANVAAAPRTMPNALLVAIPGGRHGVMTVGCVVSETTRFIESGRPGEVDRWKACTDTLAARLPAFPPAP